MSIATDLQQVATNLNSALTEINTQLTAKGGAVSSTVRGVADAVESLPSGGSDGVATVVLEIQHYQPTITATYNGGAI